MNAQTEASATRWETIRTLQRERPRSRFLRATIGALALLATAAWLSGEVEVGALFEGRRWDNLARFLTRDAQPYPLRSEGWSLGALATWARELWSSQGARATSRTLYISVVAICFAQLFALATAGLGARTVMQREAFSSHASSGRFDPWLAACALVRLLWVLLRALPEYVWAFLLLAVFGPSAWPAVIALAVHNAGILGRLDAETIENLDRAPLASLSAVGASRAQTLVHGALPLALPRGLSYFFYRFEACVREATVLGMIAFSLGYLVQDARARQRHDEMLLWVACSAALVLAADVLSLLVRRWVRRA